jgi:hypothetical protein
MASSKLPHDAHFRDIGCRFRHPLTPFLTPLAPRGPRDREPLLLGKCSRMPRNLLPSPPPLILPFHQFCWPKISRAQKRPPCYGTTVQRSPPCLACLARRTQARIGAGPREETSLLQRSVSVPSGAEVIIAQAPRTFYACETHASLPRRESYCPPLLSALLTPPAIGYTCLLAGQPVSDPRPGTCGLYAAA